MPDTSKLNRGAYIFQTDMKINKINTLAELIRKHKVEARLEEREQDRRCTDTGERSTERKSKKVLS